MNPYANPYLPAFVNQRPRINNIQPNVSSSAIGVPTYAQIHSVCGFEGARNYNLAPGSSEILAESDPNTARVYIVACDANGQKFMKAFKLIEEEEPKPITMDDLNAKMSQLLDRMDKLEEEKKNDQSDSKYSSNGPKQSYDARNQSNGRNGSGSEKSSGSNSANDAK